MCSLPSLFLTGAPASRQKRHDFLMLAFKLSKNSRKLPSLFSPTFLSFAGAKVLHFPLPPTTFFIIFQTFSIRAECQQDKFIRTRRIGREKDASGGKTEAATASGKPNGGPGGAPETAPERAGNGRAKAVTGKRQGETGTGRTGTENIPIPFTWHSLYIYMLWPHGNHGTIRRQTHGMGAAHDDAGIRQPTIPARKHYPSEDSRRT